MSDEGARINISLSFEKEALPADFVEFARESTKNTLWYVAVKVFPKNVKAFCIKAKPIEFPKNITIDGNQYLMNIEYSVKHGTGTELNGVYANKIQFIKRMNNDFDAVEDGDENVFSDNAPVRVDLKRESSGPIDQHEMFDGTKSAIENPPAKTPNPLTKDDDLPF